MDLINILTIIAAFIPSLIVIIGLYVKIQVKLKEIDTKLMNLDIKVNKNHNKFEDHEKWGLKQLINIDGKFDKIECEIKDNQNKIIDKIDNLISSFNDFRVYVEQRFKNS